MISDASLGPLVGAALLLVAGLPAFAYGFRLLRRKRAIEDTPTSKIRSVAMGNVEVEGTARTFEEITQAPFSGTPCLYFSYRIEERYTYRDENKVEHEGWKQIDASNWSVPFFIEDETGKILIDVKGAEFEVEERLSQKPLLEPDIPPGVAIRISLPRRGILRYTERFIRPGDHVYALGFAGDNPHHVDASQETVDSGKMIQARQGSLFIVADKSQKVLLAGAGIMAKLAIGGGAAFILIGLLGVIYALTLA